MTTEFWMALFGGALIGVSASLLLILNGRVAGISGILKGALSPVEGPTAWRWLFLAGLVLGGFFAERLNPAAYSSALAIDDSIVLIAGVLVGFGTAVSGGCTSGHGVCGISRLSTRSIVATITFIAAGVLTVFVCRKLGVLP